MDNLFEIIILIVFVLSGINSLFGSKKKRREKMEESDRNVRPVPRRSNLPQDESDLIDEIFGVNKTRKTQDPFDEPQVKPKTNYQYAGNYGNESTWDPEKDFLTGNETKETDVTRKEKIFDEISKIDFDKFIPSKDIMSEKIVPDHYSKSNTNKKVLELRKILKNKKAVKDSIIIAEILSKPKALRFRGNDLLR